MSEFCKYANCHNLGSNNYQGYCNEDHMKRAPERELLMKIIYSHKEIGTIKEARTHKFTSSFHCEVCKELLRVSNVYQAK